MSGEDALATGRLGVVGPGRVGTVLAHALAAAGHEVAAASGGGEAARQRFARAFPTAAVSATLDVVAGTDLVLIATPDDAIEEVVSALARDDLLRDGQRVVHVAGALGLAPLARAAAAGARIAACHPAQTVPAADAGHEVLAGAGWAVTAPRQDRGWAADLVRQAGGRPFEVADADRTLYHAALAIGSNATGAVVAVARQLLLAARIPEPTVFLAPLAAASIDNVLAGGAAAITGPVVRGDAGTLRRHLDALDADMPDLADAYRALMRIVLEEVRPALDADAATSVEAALGRRAAR